MIDHWADNMKKISESEISVYRKYRGDIDGWARCGTASERQIIDEKTWNEISDLCQLMILSKKRLLSKRLENELIEKLDTRIADKEIVNRLKETAYALSM